MITTRVCASSREAGNYSLIYHCVCVDSAGSHPTADLILSPVRGRCLTYKSKYVWTAIAQHKMD